MRAEPIPRVVVIDKIETYRHLTLTPSVGNGTPPHCSAMGKALLAHQPPEVLERFRNVPLKQYTKNTIADFGRLLEELARVRAEGYALDCEELEIGLACIGAPIFDSSGKAVAAISLSGPKSRLLTEDLASMVADVKKAAQAISERLGYQGFLLEESTR